MRGVGRSRPSPWSELHLLRAALALSNVALCREISVCPCAAKSGPNGSPLRCWALDSVLERWAATICVLKLLLNLSLIEKSWWQWWGCWKLPSLPLAAVMCWLRWAPAPFWLVLVVFLVCFCWLRGSIRISDRGKCIFTQRWRGEVVVCRHSLYSLRDVLISFCLSFYPHLQDRATELYRPLQRKKAMSCYGISAGPWLIEWAILLRQFAADTCARRRHSQGAPEQHPVLLLRLWRSRCCRFISAWHSQLIECDTRSPKVCPPRSDALYWGNWESRTRMLRPPTLPVAPTVHYPLMNTGPDSTVYCPCNAVLSRCTSCLNEDWAVRLSPDPPLPCGLFSRSPLFGGAAGLTFRGTTYDWCFSHGAVG